MFIVENLEISVIAIAKTYNQEIVSENHLLIAGCEFLCKHDPKSCSSPIKSKAENARNFTNCDSLLIGDTCGAHTVPYIEVKNSTAKVEHEATTSKISEDQKFYAMQRGIPEEEAIALIVNGFVRDVIQQLPMEFAVEAQKLLGISLEGSVG